MASALPVISQHRRPSSDCGAFHEGQLSYAGRDCVAMPKDLGATIEKDVIRLDLSCNCLRFIDGVEKFKNLKELILDNNNIGDEMEYPRITTLATLTLNKNQIKDLDKLIDKLIISYPNLTYLSLLGNEACPNELSSKEKDEEDYVRYRYYLIYRMPNLKFLDSTPIDISEKKESLIKGPFLKVIRPTQSNQPGDDNDEEEEESGFTPLPKESSRGKPAPGSFGRCKYIYYGKNSEGNRFIRNNDL